MLEIKTDYASLDDLIYRLNKRAEIREQITTRKSVQEQKPDRISELLREAARTIWVLANNLSELSVENYQAKHTVAARDAYITYLQSRLDNTGVGYAK